MSNEKDLEIIITASFCYAELFKMTVLSSVRDSDITKTQLEIIGMLSIDGPLLMSEISDKLYVKREQTTRSIKELKKMGFVSTERGERDGRNVVASLTKEGLKFLENSRKISDPLLKDYIEQLPEEDRKTLIESSRKVVEVFKRIGDFPGADTVSLEQHKPTKKD